MTARRSWWRIATAALTVTVAGVTAVTGVADPARTTDLIEPFAENSPLRTMIQAHAEVDPNSAAMIREVTWDDSANVSTVEFGIPIYTADASTLGIRSHA
ncbi:MULTISPECIES: hypothetical protein [unclassified Mycolicibacterium]|uniref:hypothetical protein n=1 Tax=unclassified Mycolicibacterium TaxID=2636767 RepID=UPI001EE47EA7|nr:MULTISPECIES: hypothetical protein [unclassified Mycolicibacterium]